MSESEKTAINQILKNSAGPMTPIVRRGGAYIMEIDVCDESDEGFEPAKKTFKATSSKNDDMEVDALAEEEWHTYMSRCRRNNKGREDNPRAE